MLDLNITIDGDKIVINNLERIADELPEAVNRGLTTIGAGIFDRARAWLSGTGAKGTTKNRKWTPQQIDPGGYPVPVRTGWLRQSLNWLHPGESMSGDAGSFTAGPFETVIFDSALYARVIREGTGSSAKYGARDYLTDGFTAFSSEVGVTTPIEQEIAKLINK
jgi:hypothetical protein